MNVQVIIQLNDTDNYRHTADDTAALVLEALGGDPEADRVSASISLQSVGAAGAPPPPPGGFSPIG